MRKKDIYSGFDELSTMENEGRNYRIRILDRPGSRVLILAPHGGGIERGTSEIAEAAAGDAFNLYLFEGIKRTKNRTLHLTSPHFDEPRCVTLVRGMDVVVAIHGCTGSNRIFLGGLDRPLVDALKRELSVLYPVAVDDPKYPASDPANLCNRGARGCGAQVEISRDLRKPPPRDSIAAAVRRAVEARFVAERQPLETAGRPVSERG